MTDIKKYEGIIPAFYACYDKNGSIDTEAVRTLRRLAEGNYAVIYITEATAADIEEELDHYCSQRLPAIILIPGVSGNTGRGIAGVKRSVEQAVGSDIIFGNDN